MDNFVDVRFDHSVFANAVYIYETFNPGSVHQGEMIACLFISMPSPVEVNSQGSSIGLLTYQYVYQGGVVKCRYGAATAGDGGQCEYPRIICYA